MSSAEATRCPYCLADLDSEDDPTVRCGDCGTAHHQACFAEHGQCTLLGCQGAAASGDDAPRPRVGAALHPLLPLGRQRLQRTASFLSVGAPEHSRAGRHHVAAPSLELALPPVVALGERLEATLVARAREPVRGQGLRLVVASYLHADEKVRPLSRVEGVVAGRPHRDWLTRIKLWRREADALLLRAGTTEVALGFDPAPLAWHGLLPTGASVGPVQVLEVHAELDAGGVTCTPAHTVLLVDGRPPPAEVGARLDPAVDVELPPLAPAGAWSPRPVVHAAPDDDRWRPVATAAAWIEPAGPPPHAPGIDLALRPLAVGGRVVAGVVSLGLTRDRFRGRLLLELTAERRGFVRGEKRWRACARERLPLAGPSPDAVDARGVHPVQFRWPLPRVLFRGKRREDRRVRVQALVVGEGRPLRSEWRDLEVVGSRTSPRRRRNG